MRNIFFIVFIICAAAISHISFAQDQDSDKNTQPLFFESLYDVPIMVGLEEIPELATSFDKPSGRIAQAGALAENIAESEILSFYEQSLLQMGWHKQGRASFKRDGEVLAIIISKIPEKTETSRLVHFTLNPL